MRNVSTISENVNPDAALAPLRHAYAGLENGVGTDAAKKIIKRILAREGKGAPRFSSIAEADRAAVLLELRIALGLELAKVTPVFPLRPERKDPFAGTHGHLDATQDPKQIRAWTKTKPNCNWGSVAAVADVDTKDPKPGKTRGIETWAAHVAEHGEPDTRKVTTPTDGLHYYVTDDLDKGGSKLGDGVDVPNYVVSPGSHVTANGKDIRATGFYQLASDKPIISVPWLAAIAPKPEKPEKKATPEYPTESLFDAADGAAMLAKLDPKDYQTEETFTPLCRSYHYATAGEGYPEFKDWALRDGDHDFKGRWDSYGKDPTHITDEHVFLEAVSAAGGGDLVAKVIVAKDFPDPVETFIAIDAEPDPIYPEPTKAKDLAAKVFPPRVEIVEGLILDGIVQTLDGDGGVGKSTAMLQASTAIAAGGPIFDRATSQRPVWFITHEDDEQDLQPVMLAMAKELGVNLADLPLEVSSLLDHDIAIADIDDNGKVKLLAFYRYLDKMLATRRGSLVVLDCLADIAQMQEAGRLAPNAFFKKVMTGLCKRHGVAIMILAHPSKAAMITGAWYSGGTGYKTAVRHKLVMKLVDPKDIYGARTLETLKKNWGKRSPPVTLSWQGGIFILDRDDATGVVKYRTVVRKILELIEGGGRVARSNQADCAKPKTLADDIRDAEGGKLVTAKEVQAFMRRAEADHVLKYFEATNHSGAHYETGDNAASFDIDADTTDDAGPDLN